MNAIGCRFTVLPIPPNPSRPYSMEPDALFEALTVEKPRCCPSCGTPYPQADDAPGCPVCLFRQAFGLETAGEPGPLAGGTAFVEGRFDHYELGRRSDGS